MKILLIRPEPPELTVGLKNIMVCEPLELEYIAAGIKNHEVEIFDMIFEKNLESKLRRFQPDIIGTSSYITGVNKVKQICNKVKSFNEDTLTVVGGVHASLSPKDFLDPNIDVIIKGEGVFTFAKIIERKIKNLAFDSIPGVVLKNGVNSDSDDKSYLKINTDKLPIPNRELIKKYSKKYYYLFHQPVTIVKTTFGCPFKCKFCYCWKLTDGKVYSRSAESVVNELSSIQSRDIYIIDDTFFVNRKHVVDIHQLILDRDIQKEYLIYGHSEFIIQNPDVIEKWSEIGLKACIIGLESPVDKELNDYEKKATVDKNDQAIKILQKYNVDVYASFIVDPSWKTEDFNRLQIYIFKNKLYYIVIQPLTPLPNTEMYHNYQNNLHISQKHYEIWDMQHSVIEPELGYKEFYKQIRKIYRKTIFNPFRVSSLNLRTVPPIFSSKYIRLLLGMFKIYFDLRRADKHPKQLERK